MNSKEANRILQILSDLMDEQPRHTEREDRALALYTEIRQEINTGLLSAVEPISYEDKYAVLDRANELADTIGLYLNYPELIGKYVIGFYEPNEMRSDSLYKRYLGSSEGSFSRLKKEMGVSNENGDLSDTIPTILIHGEDSGQIRALNLAGKQVPLSPDHYAALEPGENQPLDLRGILVSYCLSSPSVPECQAILVLPREMGRQQMYGNVLLRTADALVVRCSQVKDALKEKLLRNGNIKLLLAVGECSETRRAAITAAAGELHCKVIFAESMSAVYKTLEALENVPDTRNFDNEFLMESRLCGVLWYLAKQKETLGCRMAQINQDLLGNDAEIQALTKSLQKKIGDQIKELEQCADAYYSSEQKILRGLRDLQQLYTTGSGDGLNRHVSMYEPLLELLAAKGAFFHQYGKYQSNDHIHRIETLCRQTDGDLMLVQALVNDYFGRSQKSSELHAFTRYSTQSALILKKKIEMHERLGLSAQDCAPLIEALGEPHLPLEYRLLGQAQCERGLKEMGTANLKKALESGDREAGEYLYTHCEMNVGQGYLANNGVPAAAYERGEHLYIMANSQEGIAKAKKYLHIAAAQGHAGALELLGEVWYDEGMKAGKGKNRTESLETALAYYTAARKKKKLRKGSLEKMGLTYFEQEDYQRAKPILEEVQTPQTLFLLGTMCEKGLGGAANEKQAMEYYETAANKGHAQAQVEYTRLCAKAAEEAKKTAVTSNTSYSGSSYYSGYYTSYYSGW